jgi:beta-lactam-binding protein with PASTA domain
MGASEAAATAQLQGAGFLVTVSYQQECDPEAPQCDYRQGVVWAQSPAGGAEAELGTTVTIVVNP